MLKTSRVLLQLFFTFLLKNFSNSENTSKLWPLKVGNLLLTEVLADKIRCEAPVHVLLSQKFSQ